MRKIVLAFAIVASLCGGSARADWTAKDASLATITFKNPNVCTSVVCTPVAAIVDSTGANVVAVTTSGADGASNTANGLLSYGRNLVFNGTTWDRWMGDVTNGAWVNVKSSVLPTGAATSAGVAAVNTTLGTPMQNSGGSVTANLGTIGGAATAAAQTTAQTSLSSIDTKTPALGQALAAASVPVILPAATVTTLTPPAAITGFATSTKQSDGTQKTQIVDGAGSVIASTSNNLNVQCANCSGSGVSTADQASFTAGTSLFAGTGGFFQTTATSNPLTTGKQGIWQMTANRAGFVNLRDSSANELGVAAAPLQVSLANTAGNSTAVKVDGSAVTQPVSIASVPSHAVTVASGGIASGAVASGAVASGAVSSGAYAAGALAAGAFASGAGVDGWDLTQGAKADSVCATSTGTCTVVALLKFLNAQVSAAIPAGSAIIGQVGIDQTTDGTTNAVHLKAGTALAGKFGIDQTTPGTTNGVQVNAALPAGTNTIGTVGQLTYPVGATPLTASATGTTAATTATLAGTTGKTTYVCGYSIRANATANTSVTNTLTGVISGTMSSIMWVPANTAGLGVDEQIFSPCIPASATNTGIAAVSGAPGTGGLVSSKIWGYQL